MKLNKTILAIAAAGTLLSSFANAELVTKDWASTGDELLSYDTVSGLNWLDLSQTLGVSYNNVESRLTTDLAGWRLPTKSEVATLFTSSYPAALTYNVDGSVWVYQSGNALNVEAYDDASYFTSLFGNFGLSGTEYAYGLYKDDSEIIRMMGTYKDATGGARIFSMDYDNSYAHLADGANMQFGTLLVANNMNLPEAPIELTSVPLPASLGLLGLAMAGFGFRRKEK